MLFGIQCALSAVNQNTGPTPESTKLAQTWLAKVSPKLSKTDATLAKRAQATLLGNLIAGKPWAPYLGMMPSLGTYRGVWNWD